MEERRYDLARVRREMKKEKLPERTKAFLERGGEPEVAKEAPKLVNEFWKYIVKPEIVNFQAPMHMGTSGSKKRSGSQLAEKMEIRGEPSGTEDPPRDERGRFVSFQDKISSMGEPYRPTPPPKSVDVLLSTYGIKDPGDIPLVPTREGIKRKPKRKMEGIKFEDIQENPPKVYIKRKPKRKMEGISLEDIRGEEPVELVFKKGPNKKKKSRQTNLYEYYPPIPPPKPKKGELYSPEAEDFPSHKGVRRKKVFISEKERARRQKLSERMKVENKKKKKAGIAEFFKDEKEREERRKEKEEE